MSKEEMQLIKDNPNKSLKELGLLKANLSVLNSSECKKTIEVQKSLNEALLSSEMINEKAKRRKNTS